MKRQFILISDNFPPCNGGGIAEWAYGIASNMVMHNCDVTVLSRWKNKHERQRHKDRKFHVRHMKGRDWNRYRYWYALYYLFRSLLKTPDAIVLAATWELAAPMNILRHLFPKSRYVVIAHGLEITKIDKKKRTEKFRKTIEHALLTFAVSRFTQQQILDRLNDKTRAVRFLPNGVDTERFYPVKEHGYMRKQLGIPDKTKIILTLARVIERKGHDTVIRALPDILAHYPDTVYVIAGPWENSCYSRLQQLVAELDLSGHVIFTSFIDDRDLNAMYSMSEVYVMVSRLIESAGDSEGFGITFLEANACCCPVIGSNSGGIPDAIENGVNGYLVPADDTAALAEKILTLFDNKELCTRMGRQARARVTEHFTWNALSTRLLEAIDEQIRASEKAEFPL